MARLPFLAGLAIGYVLGARAGRERYEGIARAARRVAEMPQVQETAGLLQAQATAAARGARSFVTSRAQGSASSSEPDPYASIDLTATNAHADGHA